MLTTGEALFRKVEEEKEGEEREGGVVEGTGEPKGTPPPCLSTPVVSVQT